MKSRDGMEMIECPAIDRNADKMDSSGWWFLIRANFWHGIIEVAACHKDIENNAFIFGDDPGQKTNHVHEIFYGRCAQDIYHKIFEERNYVTSPTHAAYLGKELKKAEMALVLGIHKFYQE